MNNLKYFKKTELDSKIKSLAKQERELLAEIIDVIKEIDRRRVYLELGYANLFSYLTESVGYSAASAQRRIDAARLSSEVPELKNKIESGEIKLNQISLIQKVSREVYRATNQKVSTTEKIELLETLVNKTQGN